MTVFALSPMVTRLLTLVQTHPHHTAFHSESVVRLLLEFVATGWVTLPNMVGSGGRTVGINRSLFRMVTTRVSIQLFLGIVFLSTTNLGPIQLELFIIHLTIPMCHTLIMPWFLTIHKDRPCTTRRCRTPHYMVWANLTTQTT